ncbi:MAG: transposase, partial [Clostridia bacterium]|nr:transposase [Clostridia bacterium]
TKQMLRGVRVASQEELQKRLYKYFEEINADLVVYHWNWKLEEIDVSADVNTTTLLDENV